jgi:signal transduction histidine kinase
MVFKKTTLFSKILSISAFIIAGAVLILLSSVYVQWKLKQQSIAKDIQLQLLDAQRRLNDFQFRGNINQIDSINASRIAINKDIDYFNDDEDLEELERSVNAFFDKFEDLIQLCIKRGIDEDSGMEGDFRERIHNLQKIVKDEGLTQAQILALELRRREKDFIMRGDSKYIDSVKSIAKRLEETIQMSQLRGEMKKRLLEDIALYTVGFLKLSDVSQLINTRYEELNEMNTNLMAMGMELNSKKSQKAEIAQFFIFSVMGSVLVVSIILSLWMSRRISKPISDLKDAANQLASGNLNVQVKNTNTRDEVEELSASFQKMVTQIKQRTDELMDSNQQLKMLNDEIMKQQALLKQQSKEIEQNNLILFKQNNDLEALLVEKNEFLGIVSHDLKNPLQSIKMAAQLMKTDTSLTKNEVSEFSADILTSSARMFDLIKNLLDANAVEQGKVKVSYDNFDTGSIVDSVVTSYEHRAKEKGISIKVEKPTHPIFMYGDSGLSLQVLDNLISNAVKYSPHNSHINIKISTDSDNSIGMVSVKDEGPGLSESDQAKLFNKFSRLTPQPTGGEHSTGLGLSITKKLTEMMGGNVKCDSELGKGCVFTFSLPLSSDILVN